MKKEKETIGDRVFYTILSVIWNLFPTIGVYGIMDSLEAPLYVCILSGIISFLLFIVIEKLNDITHILK